MINYLLRVVSPKVTYDIAHMFDKWVMNRYMKKHSLEEGWLTQGAKLQIVLPDRCSEMSLTDHIDTCWHAYWGSSLLLLSTLLRKGGTESVVLLCEASSVVLVFTCY